MAKRNYRKQLLAWSIVTALVPATMATALAQDAPAGNASSTATVDATKAADATKTTTLKQITVHAQKRVEYLQDVPITMVVADTQQLHDAGVHDFKDLQMLVPALSVASSDSEANTTARIRGVGTTGDNAGLESSVGIVIDGVPRARNGVGFGDLGELSSIEVLKGPQGTVFGKNTSVGVINISTQRPSFTEQGYADFTIGNYHDVGVDASYSNKITDTVAFRLYAVDRQHDGYNDVFVNNGPRTLDKDGDQNFHSIRGQLLFTPTKDLDIRVIGDYTEHNENCCVAVTTLRDPGIAALTDAFAGGPGRGVIPVADPSKRLAYTNSSTQQKIVDEGVSTEINWNTPWLNNATLTSITSVRKWTLESASDIDFNGADLADHDFSPDNGQRFNTFTQELHLTGSTDTVDWLGGVYFDNVRLQRAEKITENAQYEGFLSTLLLSGIAQAFPPGLVNTANPQNFLSEVTGQPYGATYTGVAQKDRWDQSSKSAAAFGNATWHVTDALAITGGLRYTHEEKTTHFNYLDPNGGLGCLAAISTNGIAKALVGRGIPAAYVGAVAPTVIGNMCLPWQNPLFNGLSSSDKLDENEWSGTLKAAYRWNDNFLTYASGARGYKAGGFNLARVQSGDGTTSGGSGIFPVTNTSFPGEFVDSYELGAKTTWADGNLLLNAALFHSEFSDYQLNTFSGISWVVDSIPKLTSQGADIDLLWQTPLHGLTLQGAATYTDAKFGDQVLADPVLAKLPGSQAAYAPKWAASGGVAYQWDFNSSLMGRFNVNARYSSDYNASGSLVGPQYVQDAYTLLDARLTIGAINKRWSVELWGQNLTNRTYAQALFNPALQSPTVAAFLGAPRTYGLTFHLGL